jgi:hypothetical protein
MPGTGGYKMGKKSVKKKARPKRAKTKSFRASKSFEDQGNQRRPPKGLKLWSVLLIMACGTAYGRVGGHDRTIVIRWPSEPNKGRLSTSRHKKLKRAMEAKKRAQIERKRQQEALQRKFKEMADWRADEERNKREVMKKIRERGKERRERVPEPKPKQEVDEDEEE